MELTRPVQDQILSELNQLTDVCDVLKSLHIAIGFLSSAGGDPSMSIREYLHSGLKMTNKNGLKSGKVNQYRRRLSFEKQTITCCFSRCCFVASTFYRR